MSTETEQIARALQQSHLKFEAGQIESFGVALVRPNDNYYAITGAAAHGAKLEIHLTCQGQPAASLVLEGASGFSAGSGTLTIAKAAKVSWDAWTLAHHGARLHVTTANGTEDRDPSSAPALHLIA